MNAPKDSGPEIRFGISVIFEVAFTHKRIVSPFNDAVVGAGDAGIVAAAVLAAVSFAFTSNRPCEFP